ncbi:hypothetical protein ACWIGW_02235 [Nocardia brasiliensis]
MAPSAVEITLIEFAASWIMEGGEVLPEPGEEGTWRTPCPEPSAGRQP